MELEEHLLKRVRNWDEMSRWERSELGRDLRREGWSYGEIMDLIPVKKSTLATWCRDVALSDEQHEEIRRRTGSRLGIPVNTQWRRRLEIEKIREEARSQVRELMNEPIWIAGTVLYWAEGAKTRNHLRLNNADPRTLRLFIRWVREFLNPDARFSLQLHLHAGNDDLAARQFWIGQTGLKDANFYRTFIKPAGTGHRKNHLLHGICTVTLREGSDSWQTAMEWIRTLANEFGLENGPN